VPEQQAMVEFPTGRLQGYKLPWHKDFTIGFMLRGGIVEQAVSDAAERILQKDDVVFDIGANLGYTAVHFADLVGSQGKVFAFEPDPELATRLEIVQDLNSLPQLVVRREAVSRERGQAQFFIGEESYLGRLADSSEVGTSNRLITVSTMSVDRLVADEGIARVALVKIDVEGGELNVLYGMSETLRRHKPMLLIEFHSSELEERGISFLKERGYQCGLLNRARPPEERCHHLCRPL
jgi:FkbM family methyltransferase